MVGHKYFDQQTKKNKVFIKSKIFNFGHNQKKINREKNKIQV